MLRFVEKKDKFTTSIFKKDPFSGVYTNFSIFTAFEYKFALVDTLLHRCFTIASTIVLLLKHSKEHLI